jgi:hypothetical protein
MLERDRLELELREGNCANVASCLTNQGRDFGMQANPASF